jgi:hypothetical protein
MSTRDPDEYRRPEVSRFVGVVARRDATGTWVRPLSGGGERLCRGAESVPIGGAVEYAVESTSEGEIAVVVSGGASGAFGRINAGLRGNPWRDRWSM